MKEKTEEDKIIDNFPTAEQLGEQTLERKKSLWNIWVRTQLPLIEKDMQTAIERDGTNLYFLTIEMKYSCLSDQISKLFYEKGFDCSDWRYRDYESDLIIMIRWPDEVNK